MLNNQFFKDLHDIPAFLNFILLGGTEPSTAVLLTQDLPLIRFCYGVIVDISIQ